MLFIIIASMIILTPAFVLLTIGYYLLNDYRMLQTESFELISGTISSMIKERNPPDSYSLTSYYPVVDFIYHNTPHSIKTREEVNLRNPKKAPDGKKYAVGDVVKIRIYNSDVNTAIMENKAYFKRSKADAIRYLVFGSTFLILWLLFIAIV